jgi:hypothetical protein
VGVDTWDCSREAPPSLPVSVRSFADRAQAAAAKQGAADGDIKVKGGKLRWS